MTLSIAIMPIASEFSDFLQSCEAKSGMESLGSRLEYSGIFVRDAGVASFPGLPRFLFFGLRSV